MINEIMRDAEERMDKAIESLEQDFRTLRTGRASPALLDRIRVDYYGSPTPLNQLASIGAPEARLLVIKPFDPNTLSDIERAIYESDLNLTPNNDGKVIRLNLPTLTEERRHELVRTVHSRLEEARVAIRNIRRDALHMLDDLENEGEISEDAYYRYKDQIQELTDNKIEEAEGVGKAKEEEILEV